MATKQVHVRVSPKARKDGIAQEGELLRVRVRAPASKGRANKALIGLLAEYFEVKKSCIRIVKGERSRDKTVEVDINDEI